MMKKSNFYIFLSLILYPVYGYGQHDSITQLEEVILSDIHLFRNSETNQVQVLSDSVLEQNSPALTSLLKFNTPLFFRENGPGMVASASFRGTSASQTAVVWNGININSQFTGQTDFNTLLTSGYDNVAVRSGGGAVLYGSGAIGGSVHLNNKFRFGSGFDTGLQLEYGSFETFYGSANATYASDALSLQFNLARQSSENDFPYPNSEKSNENGDYQNSAVSAAAAYILNEQNILKFYSNFYDGDRGFSGTLSLASRSKYEDLNTRNLLEWNNYSGSFISRLKVAYLTEAYKYFENRSTSNYSFGKASTALTKYHLTYNAGADIEIGGLLELQQTTGKGTNIEETQERKTGSAGVMFSQNLFPFKYDLSARAEFSDKYDSPILFSAGAAYELSANYLLRLNFSRNYRIPTFNDLFWYAGGNQDLRPEKSLQAEIGQEIHLFGTHVELTAFLIDTEDLLRWVPASGGRWVPQNTEKARNYGVETIVKWSGEFQGHRFTFNGTYAYTRAIDRSLNKELIYVPTHKATASAGHAFGRMSSYFQILYNGQVYTSSDNKYILPDHTVSNAGLNYSFLQKRLHLGVKAQNIFNSEYQSMPSRPMPGRSFQCSLTFNY
ncbi:TonB-dependent receptor plug domain-containing protein [Salinimicrobium oceani]|uniref:TonB-dependent receptor n=1 Tax=Salinimicrobium oceani TaxID=2722702 RepID=A0ABX1CWW4_9FLAO|nr:TonB-dependent receptor [Salinimicrobium oceani]NJW52759.1 TonB-dependent receptor [Salinimicrobium oceani]